MSAPSKGFVRRKEAAAGTRQRTSCPPSLTVENYIKAVLHRAMESGMEWVATGQLAAALNVTPGTVTTMLKMLASRKLVTYKPYWGVQLTKSGRELGLRVVRRHRLIELFLARTLHIPWDAVHDEAERMEHSVSDGLIDRIDDFLDHPQADPHGDPIPSADGHLRNEAVSAIAVPFARCATGDRVKLIRVIDQRSGFLRSLTKKQLTIGSILEVENILPSERMVLRLGNSSVAIGRCAAEQLLVEQLPREDAA